MRNDSEAVKSAVEEVDHLNGAELKIGADGQGLDYSRR